MNRKQLPHPVVKVGLKSLKNVKMLNFVLSAQWTKGKSIANVIPLKPLQKEHKDTVNPAMRVICVCPIKIDNVGLQRHF